MRQAFLCLATRLLPGVIKACSPFDIRLADTRQGYSNPSEGANAMFEMHEPGQPYSRTPGHEPRDGVLVVLSWAEPGTKAGMQLLLLWLHVRDLRMEVWPMLPRGERAQPSEVLGTRHCTPASTCQCPGPPTVVSNCCPVSRERLSPPSPQGLRSQAKTAGDCSHPLQVRTFLLRVSHPEKKRQTELGNEPFLRLCHWGPWGH